MDTNFRRKVMNEVLKIEDLDELKEFLYSYSDIKKLQSKLLSDFLKLAISYKNVSEWNKCVKLSECLAIVGWGNSEPLEAICGKFFNGNPDTFFINEFGEHRFKEVIWSKRKTGFTIDRVYMYKGSNQESNFLEEAIIEDIQDLKLRSQRNWIEKNPIRIRRIISNCYENSKVIIESIEKELQQELNKTMKAKNYGKDINIIFLTCCFSYYDNAHCKTNYIIDESNKISVKNAMEELLKFYSKDEISEKGYYLRPRFSYGSFKAKTGKIDVTIHLEEEFSKLNHIQQKKKLREYFLIALENIANKQKKKIPNYNFNLMIEDFTKIIDNWVKLKI